MWSVGTKFNGYSDVIISFRLDLNVIPMFALNIDTFNFFARFAIHI